MNEDEIGAIADLLVAVIRRLSRLNDVPKTEREPAPRGVDGKFTSSPRRRKGRPARTIESVLRPDGDVAAATSDLQP
jgi:hypothetical protein